MAITPLPAAPEVTDTPQEFNTKAFAWVASLDTFVTEANAQATSVNADATLAEEWASKTDGQVDTTDYSAKAWAVGGTGVTDTASRGAAKEWATETASTVDGTEYSAKEYAVGTQTRGTTGSAKDWATYTSGTVDGSGYSAKYHAEAASTSATQAAASAAQAAASANVTQWSSGATYAVGDNVFSPSDFQTYRNTTGTNTATDPSSDPTNWERITGGAPGGSDTQIQYNSSGSFAGASGLVTDGSNLTINAQGDLRLADSDSSNYIALQAPATVASDVTLTLPDTAGSNGQVLSTNGSGTLSWVDQSGGGGGGGTSVTVTQITATASQTDFSVTYTVGQLSVYLNGALLASADYTATNGTSVVLASGAASGDIFTAVAYSTVAGLEIDSASPYLTAVGSGAGAVNTGTRNVFVGFESGNDNTSAVDNTAVGAYSLDANTTGGSNNAFGVNALGANTTGANNVAVGSHAMATNTTGIRNTAMGHFALYENVSGNYNTAIGHEALNVNTASNNTAVGYAALIANTTGGNNTAVGYQALDACTTGNSNTALGQGALGGVTTGFGNIGIGNSAALALTTGQENIVIGYPQGFGGWALSGGSYNVFIGARAGEVVTTGGTNICFGYYANPSSATGNNQFVVGTTYGATGKGDNTGFISPNGGGVYQGNNSSSWSTTSDQRLKKNIVDNTDGLNKINALRVRNFEYRTEDEVTELDPTCAIKKEGVQLGVIAQELQEVCPDCVKEETTGVLSVDSDNIFWHMVNAIKELSAKCDSLQAEINTLKGQ